VLEVVNISNTPGPSEYPAIAADSRGYFYVVWEERAPNGIPAVYITQRPPGSNWTKPEPIIMPQTSMRQPAIAIDKENTIHIVGQYTIPPRGGEIFYTKKPLGGDWSEIETIGMFGRACQPKIGVDNEGNIHIVWQELVGYGPIIYAKRSKDGSWTIPVEISKDAGGYNYIITHKIALDHLGYTHVVFSQYVEHNSYQLEELLMYVTNYPSGAFTGPVVVCRDSLCEIGSSPQIIAIDNRIYVIWAMKGDIYYTCSFLDSQWQSPARVCSTTAISGGPHITKIHRTLHLVWTDVLPTTIFYTKKENNHTWKEPQQWIFASERIFGAADIATTGLIIGIILYGWPEDSDNPDIYFGEIPIN
jgi:hypothetical protein